MAKQGNQSDKDWEAALKAVEAFDKKVKSTVKSAENLKGAFSNVATELFGISGSAFFTETALSIDEIIKKEKELAKASNDLSSVQKKIADDMRGAFGGLENKLKGLSRTMSGDLTKAMASVDFVKPEDIKSLEQVNKLLEDETLSLEKKKKLQDLQKEFIKDSLDFQEKNKKAIEEELKSHPDFMRHASEKDRFQAALLISQGGFNELVEKEVDLTGKILRLSTEKNGEAAAFSETQMQNQIQADNLVKSMSSLNEELKKGTKESFTLGNALKDVVKNFSSGIISSMKETNQALKDGQRDFGLSFKGMSTEMAGLTSKAAEFNMSTKDTVQMMGQLGEELKTTDTNYLASATEHFVAIQKATGISSEEVTTIAGEMMRAGNSAEDVENAMEGANKTAKIFGVNTKKVLQGVAKNLDKMRQMGFQGGVESLTKMVAEAERLRLNIDEVFDMGKRARSIEGAMDMAAELQLAGGSFAQVNPMDLLSAARKGPEELQNILKTMGDDIGKFDEKTGEFTFDAVDVDRLQIMADATGVSLDSMQKMIQKNAEDNKKMDFMPDMQLGEVLGPDGKPLDQDMMNNMLLDAVDVNGKALEGGLLDEAGVDSLEDLTADQATQLIQQKLNDQATLEEQAKQNQSFDDSITAFKDAIMNMFTVFQPFIEFATGLIQGLIEMGPVGKFLGAALIGFIAIAPMLGKSLEGFKAMAGVGKSMLAGAKGMLGMGKKATDVATGGDAIPGANSKDPTEKGGGKSGLQSLADGLRAMGDPKILMGIGNTALAGPALALLLLGVPTLLLMAGVGAMGKLVVAGFKATADGLDAMGQAKGIIRGAIAMVIVGASLIPFAFALQMMAGVSWGTVLIALTMMAAGVLVLMGIGAIVTGPGGLMLLMGALALVAVGVALMAFGASLLIFAAAAQMMQGLEFGWLGDLGWNLLLAAPGLILGGIALGIASPFLMVGAIGLMAIATAALTVSQVDWSAFALMGDALMGIVPGLLGFGFAGLMFLNPILLLGMLLMIGNLGMLAMVMVPLAESLTTGADGLDRFADGLTKLQAAANSLDLEKLEMLKDLSWSMAMAGMMGGGMGDQIQKIAEALAALTKTSAGGGGGGTKKIEINLKMNGRDIQNIIVDDTSIVS